MILADVSLIDLVFHHDPPLLAPSSPDHVNPGSVDIRIGTSMLVEQESSAASKGPAPFDTISLSHYTEANPYYLDPGAFALVATMEKICVPNGYALELRLKSSTARRGFDHTMAFWFDPGWQGIGTMEIQNILRYHSLPLWPGMRFAQVIVHRLDKDARWPYGVKPAHYQGATGVEGAKT